MVSMSSLGAFSGTIRFLTYTPWFVLVFYAFPVYEEVKSHPELYHAPYNTKVPTAAACAGIASIMGVVWTFISWMPAYGAKGAGAFVICFVDATIMTLLFTQVVIGPSFIPLDGCKKHNMTTYGVPEGHRSMFLIVANQTVVNKTVGVGDSNNWIKGAEQASYDSCMDFVTIWGMCFPLLILFIISTFCNFLLMFADSSSYGIVLPPSLAWIFPFFDWLINWLIKWPWWHSYPFIQPGHGSIQNKLAVVLILIFIDIPLLGPTLLIAMLPTITHQWMWIGIRFTGKFSSMLWQRLTWAVRDRMPTGKPRQPVVTERKKSLELKVLPKHRPSTSASRLSAEMPPQPRTPEDRLADFFIVDILMLVSRDLHFRDLINLSLTSKRMRQLILPPGPEAAGRWHLYKLYTCDPNTRRRCDGCPAQICTELGCGLPRPVNSFNCGNRQRLLKHYPTQKASCLPYCFACWDDGRNQDCTSRLACACTFASANLIMCAACCAMPDKRLSALMLEREEKALRAQKVDGVECGQCKKLIGGVGPRWWVCSKCQKECRCGLHPAWSWEREKPVQTGDAA